MAARRRRKQNLPPASVPQVHFKGVGLALAVTVGMVLMVTVIAAASAVSELTSTWLLTIGAVVSVLVGSIYVGRRLGKSGMLNGGIIGLAYALVLVVLALLLDMGISAKALLTLVAAFALGAVGGVTGVNSR